MASTNKRSVPIVNENHSVSCNHKSVYCLEITLMACSLLGVTGFCVLCAIFFSYSGAFILHLCLVLIGGLAALTGVFTHFPSALLLHIIVQVASIVYLLIIAVLSLSIHFNPSKWQQLHSANFVGHTNDEIRRSGVILMFFSLSLIPVSACSLTAAIKLFHKCGKEKKGNMGT